MSTTQTDEALTGPITAAQRRALFAFARAHDLDIDDLRDHTPSGSISALTRAEASGLLNRLNAGTGYAHPRRRRRAGQRVRRLPKGVYRLVTEAQRRKIEALRMDLGWTPEHLRDWLSERHFIDKRPMSAILEDGAAVTSKDGVEVIELLKAVLAKSRRADKAT